MADDSGYANEKKNKIVKRAENFDQATLAFLCDEVEKYIDVINSKHTNTVTNKKKCDAWEKVADAVNARGGVRRTVPQLKEKYRKAVSKAKIDVNLQKREAVKTGGGNAPKPLNNTMQKIYDLNAQTPSFLGISNGIDLGISVFGDTINVDDAICMLDDHDTQYQIDTDWSDTCGPYNQDASYIGDDHTVGTVCVSNSQVRSEEQNRSETDTVVPSTSTCSGRDGHTVGTVCVSNSQVRSEEWKRSNTGTEHNTTGTEPKRSNTGTEHITTGTEPRREWKRSNTGTEHNTTGTEPKRSNTGTEHITTGTEPRRDLSRSEKGTKHHSTSTMSGKGKQSKTSNVVRPCSRTSKIQETVNLRQLQIETLATEKRKSETEIEKLREETVKLKSEVCKLEEERDLYKVQKEYYKLKLKRLREEMNEQ